MSAAVRRSFQPSTQKAKWCSPPLGPVIRAMSWERVGHLEPGRDLEAVVAEHLLGEPEVEVLDQETA